MKLSAILRNKDALGWLTWAGLTLVLIGPCIYLMYAITYDTATAMTRITTGIFVAAILSGLLTWLGNELWYRWQRHRAAGKRKSGGKTKRSAKAKNK